MSKFVELLEDVLTEKGKTYEDLENDKIIAKRTHYRFNTLVPYLDTILKIANYLEISLDYLTNKTNENNFKKYNIENLNFYNKLKFIMEKSNITVTKLCDDIKIGRSNFSYWKNGSLPKFNLLVEISNYLNCYIDDLLETL